MSHRIINPRNGRPNDDTPSNRDAIRIQLWTGIVQQLLSYPLRREITNPNDASVPVEIYDTVSSRANESVNAADLALARFDENFPG